MDGKIELMNDLDVAHNAIQTLRIEPTKSNMTNMMFVLQTLEKAYQFVSNIPDAPAEPAEKDDADA